MLIINDSLFIDKFQINTKKVGFLIYNLTKIMISAILIAIISYISKKSTIFGAIFASVPLVSVLAIVWLYVDTKDVRQISALSVDIFWLVLPSLIFFIALPILLRKGLAFAPSMLISLILMIIGYLSTIKILEHFK